MGYVDYNALQVKFQRRFANNFSFLNSYTWGKSIDLNSDNDGQVTVTNVLRLERYNRAVVRLRHPAHVQPRRWIWEAAVGARQVVRRLAAERPVAGPRRPAADHHADAGRAVHGQRERQPAEPDLQRRGGEPDDRPVVRPVVLRSRRPTSRARTATPAATSSAGRVRSTSTRRSSRTRGSAPSRPRCGSRRSTCSTTRSSATRTRRSATRRSGTITAMLSSPSCSLCGTVERQMQLGVKMRF